MKLTAAENPFGVHPGQTWRDGNDSDRPIGTEAATVRIDKIIKSRAQATKGKPVAKAVRSRTGYVSTILLTNFDGQQWIKVSD